MTEFNLSDKIDYLYDDGQISCEAINYIKEAVRLLKEPYEKIIKEYEDNSLSCVEEAYKEIQRIDKIFGDKLAGEKLLGEET